MVVAAAAPVAAAPPAKKSSPLPLILVLLFMFFVVVGLGGYLGLRYLRRLSGGGSLRPDPTIPVAVIVTPTAAAAEVPTQTVVVTSPLPTFTPTEIPVLPTPTQVAVAWRTVAIPTPSPTYAFQATPAPTPPPTATSVPTEPPTVATFRVSKGVKFSTSPDSAELWVKGVKIGTADDWDDMGGGKVWEPGRGTYFVRMSLKGYKTVWIKVIVDPGAKEDVGDVDTDLEETN
jgi:hypothetical protein